MNDFPKWEDGIEEDMLPDVSDSSDGSDMSSNEPLHIYPEDSAEEPISADQPESTVGAQPDDLAGEESKPAADAEQESTFADFSGDNSEFQELCETGPASPVEDGPKEPKVPRKGRPKKRRGEGFLGIPNLLVTMVWLALVVLIGVTIGRMMWIVAAEVLAFGREDSPVTITIYEDDDIDDVTKKLYDNHLIRYPRLFKLYADFAVDEGEIHPGMWDLNTQYDYHALVKGMSPSSTRSVVKVLIPEGFSCRQIFSLLEESKVCTVQDLEKYCTEGELPEYWFLDTDMERGRYCLEGYLFPDTYEFYQNDKPESVLGKMMLNFDNRFDEDLRLQISNVNDKVVAAMKNSGKDKNYIAEHQIGIREIVIIASLIERETSSAAEGYTISSVIYNRLYNWGKNPPYLNIDAAIVYALDGKNNLTLEDLQVESPYNTYKYTGLTPGPIANPGLNSLKAALYPSNTNFFYYVLDPAAGEHHFSRTLEEHNAFRAKLG